MDKLKYTDVFAKMIASQVDGAENEFLDVWVFSCAVSMQGGRSITDGLSP